MRKVFMKFNLMRVRQKLSYFTLVRNMTLSELWLTHIKISFEFLTKSNQIPYGQFDKEEEEIFEAIPKMQLTDSLKRLVEIKM